MENNIGEQNNKVKLTDYEWLTQMGLCHKCRKNKVAPNKKFCFDCLEKIREINLNRYDSEKAKAYQERRREIYRQKKENGICIRCNKRATHGMYCYECYIKQRRRNIERAEKAKISRHERGLIPEERKRNGLCLWCGKKAVNGINACEKHRDIFSQAAKKAAKNDEWMRGFWNLMSEKAAENDKKEERI